MHTLYLVLYILAGVCFFLAWISGWAVMTRPEGSPWGVTGRANLIPLGLLLWVLVPLITLAKAG